MDFLLKPWPWYVTGPLIGLMVPVLLLLGNKQFGISSSMRHLCAACIPSKIPFFQYDWKSESWNLWMVAGVLLGGVLGSTLFSDGSAVNISADTVSDLQALGVTQFDGLMPADIFSFGNLLTGEGLIMIVLGGFMVGFGTRYAGGCTSGHAIMGLSYLQPASLVAVIGFFMGGLFTTHVLLPLIL